MKKLVITIDINDNNEMFISTEQMNLTPLEILGVMEQVKHIMLSQKPKKDDVPPLSNVIEEKEDNTVPLNP